MPETIDIQIDPEFSRLIPPLAPEELAQLESSILAEGCRDALVVWRGLLLDGHNRLRICEEHGLPYRTIEIDLPDREAAADWIDANQRGRRNLNPDQFKVLLGEMYNRAKKAVPNPDGIGGKSGKIVEDQIDPQQSTADRIADQFQVSAPTVKRAGALVRTMTPEAKQAVLTGQATLLQVKREQREAKREERRQENAVKAQAVEPIRAELVGRGEFYDAGTPLMVRMLFVVTKPPSATKKRKHPVTRPDLDNYMKLALDSCNGFLWADDSQVCDLQAMKVYGTPPRIELEVVPLGQLFA